MSSMAGTNFFTPISATCWVALTEEEGQSGAEEQFAMVAKCLGNPNTVAIQANVYEHGCLMTRTDSGSGNPAVYQNTGTRAIPVWTLFDTGTGDLVSINGDSTPAQVIAEGVGINVASAAGTTTISADLSAGANISLTPAGNNITIAATGVQQGLQFEDEGVALGTSGTATNVDFVGAGVTATRIGNDVTVTIPAAAGSAGLTAYGYAAAQADAVIGANGDVVFDLGASPFPNAGFTSVPAPAGTTFVVATTGHYEFNFFVRGTHAAAATTPLQFALWRNGAVASVGGNAFEFSGQCLSGVATEEQTVVGQGIILLTAADTITLHNRTNTVTDAVTVTSIAGGVGAGHPNATLTLKKLN